MATPAQLVEARKKARLSPRNGKRGKRKTTLAKEEARERYIERVVNKLDKITDVQLRAVLKEKNARERMYTLDQAVGKAKETFQFEGFEFEFDDKNYEQK